MSLLELGNYAGTGGIVLVVVLLLVQIAPIKIDPLSHLAKMFGNAINVDIIKKVDAVTDKLDKHVNKSNKRHYTSCRIRILRFGEEILQGKKHTKEHFDQVLIDINDYEKFCRDTPDYHNNVAGITIQRIKDVYAKCLSENSFE